MTASYKDDCDIRIWSKECEHSTFTSSEDKYLCEFCEKIPGLDHEVHHETFPYVSGDYEKLS